MGVSVPLCWCSWWLFFACIHLVYYYLVIWGDAVQFWWNWCNNKDSYLFIGYDLSKKLFWKWIWIWIYVCQYQQPYFRNMIDLSIDKFIIYVIIEQTRTTRTPAFWDTPTAPWLPILVKKTKSKWQTWKKCQKYKFVNFARNVKRDTSEVDSIIDINWAQPELKALQNGRTDRRTDGRTETNIPPPPPPPPQQLCCAGL